MKKLLIIIAVATSAIVTNAASFKWSAANIYNPTDSTAKLASGSGTATLYAYLSTADASSAVAVATTALTSDGGITKTFEDTTNFTVGNDYTFFFKLEANGYELTSGTVTKGATVATTENVNFGNMKTATTTGGAWQSVPEPTSGLLLLLGMAGLALKRKRA